MTVFLEEFGSGAIDRKREFLLSRVKSHLDQVGPLKDRYMALAGRYHMDIAALWLFQENARNARKHFKKAGNLLIACGIPEGFLAIGLSGTKGKPELSDSFLDQLTRRVRLDEMSSGSVHEAEERTDQFPLLNKALNSDAQWVRLWLGLRLQSESYGASELISEFQEIFEQRFTTRSRADLGVTEFATGDFVWMTTALGNVSTDKDVSEHDYARIRRSLFLSFLRRGEYIRDIKHDKHHWKFIPHPSKLLDIDLLATFLGMAEQDFQLGEQIDSLDGDIRGLSIFPYNAAQWLRS